MAVHLLQVYFQEALQILPAYSPGFPLSPRTCVLHRIVVDRLAVPEAPCDEDVNERGNRHGLPPGDFIIVARLDGSKHKGILKREVCKGVAVNRFPTRAQRLRGMPELEIPVCVEIEVAFDEAGKFGLVSEAKPDAHCPLPSDEIRSDAIEILWLCAGLALTDFVCKLARSQLLIASASSSLSTWSNSSIRRFQRALSFTLTSSPPEFAKE